MCTLYNNMQIFIKINEYEDSVDIHYQHDDHEHEPEYGELWTLTS